MSTGRLDVSGVFQPVTVRTDEAQFSLSTDSLLFRENGIEFLAPTPVALWAEVTLELRSPTDGKMLRGAGVVVDCSGNRHSGYVVTLLFTNLTRQSRERLAQLAQAQAQAR